MSIRQQRSKQNRRVTTNANPARPEDIVWSVISITSTQVAIFLHVDPTEIVQAGITQLHNVTDDTYPASAALAGNTLTLTYGTTISGNATFTLGTADPAVRTKWGGFMQAQSITPNTVVPADWACHVMDANTIIVAPTNFVGTAGLPSNWTLTDITTGNVGTALAVSGAGWSVTVAAGGLAAGHTIEIGGTTLTWWNGAPQVLALGRRTAS